MRRARLAAMLCALVVSAGCAAPAAEPHMASLTPVSGFSDVHGLAVDPEDADVLYVATHRGLVRGERDASWMRVGDLQDDLMGFSIHPHDARIMWASGHPAAGGNLGVIRSDDGGASWRQIALPGVDFHAMAVSPAHPDRLWGQWRGETLRSDDGGHTWAAVAPVPDIVYGYAPHPHDADRLLAATRSGLYESSDGGQTWKLLKPGPHLAAAHHPEMPDILWAATPMGVERSDDGGSNWTLLGLQMSEEMVGFIAVSPHDTDTLYAATYQTAIHKSVDGGLSWTLVMRGR